MGTCAHVIVPAVHCRCLYSRSIGCFRRRREQIRLFWSPTDRVSLLPSSHRLATLPGRNEFYTVVVNDIRLYWNFRADVSCEFIEHCSGAFVAFSKSSTGTFGLGRRWTEQVSSLPENKGLQFECMSLFF
jgi:hypothetical protein